MSAARPAATPEYRASAPASLAALAERAPVRRLSRGAKVVVFSDLHLGAGRRRDDFLPNGELLAAALRRYYLPGRYTLVLNGNVEELQRFYLPQIRRQWAGFFYDSPLLVPCLFNSGCCIGKRGLAGLEIAEGSIALVHWFDQNRSRRTGEALPGTPYRREVLEQEPLDYLFTRVRLLS